MNLPSERYFELVKTEEDYAMFISSGMSFEVESFCPFSWQEHLSMVEYKQNLELNKEEE
jgi:hypothetical protein